LSRDDDRHPDGRADTATADLGRVRTFQLRVVVDAGGLTGGPYRSKNVRVFDWPALADPGQRAVSRVAGALGHRAVGLVPDHAHDRDIDDAGDLLGDHGKQVLSLDPLCYQRRHTP
jgi:hypothetical protein